MNTMTSRILVLTLVVLAGLNLFLVWTIWSHPELRIAESRSEEVISSRPNQAERGERQRDRAPEEMNRPFQRDQEEMQRRAEQFLRQRFGLTDEQSRQFGLIRQEHMRSAIETQRQINTLRRNLLLKISEFAPSPNDVKDQQDRLAQVDRVMTELQQTEEFLQLQQQLMELERRNLQHMIQLRALMNADQVEQFDLTMPRYLFRFQQGSGGGPDGGPGGEGLDGGRPGGPDSTPRAGSFQRGSRL